MIGWGEDRAQAVARLRRALQEYQVLGIRTTIPFFQWLLQQEAFLTGRFDTTFVDTVLRQREGAFAELTEEAEEVAAIAAALHAYWRTGSVKAGSAGGGQTSAWKHLARREALR